MKILFIFALALLAGFSPGCSSQKSEKAASSGEYATKHEGQIPAPAGTTIKRNAAAVTAVVESVAVLDDVRYRIFVRLSAATASEGMESPAEPGQRLVLSPEYALDENGNIDHSNERNKRVTSLRSARPGDQFNGTISIVEKKGWVIVDVEKH